MAIAVGQTLEQLRDMAHHLGIKYTASGKNGRLMKEDLIKPLRNYFLRQRYGSLKNVPIGMKFMLALNSPMLAKRLDACKPAVQEEVWDSEGYIWEHKLNGARLVLIKFGKVLNMFSRHNDTNMLLPIDYREHVLLKEFDNRNLEQLPDFILDVEITSPCKNLSTVLGDYGVVTATELQAVTALLNCTPEKAIKIQKESGVQLVFKNFDVIYFESDWVTGLPLSGRREIYIPFVEKLRKEFNFPIELVECCIGTREEKKKFLENIFKRDIENEGCVCKKLSSFYRMDGNRGDDWVKVKKSINVAKSVISDVDGAGGDTFDGWISGFTKGNGNFEGMIGSFDVSIWLEKENGEKVEHVIACISGIDLELRQKMTKIIGGVVSINPEYLNQVVEIDGQGISPRQKRVNHATFLGFRYDKMKDSCCIEESTLNSLIG